MNIYHDIDPQRIHSDSFDAVIEITKGSKTKYELDKSTGMLVLDRILHTSMVYPANYGFIPRTYSDDKDPLDVIVLCSEPIIPLTIVNCRPIGVLFMIDDGDNDEKIIAIHSKDPFYNNISDISELPNHISLEIKHFFENYKALENKKTVINNIEGAESAERVINAAIDNYKNHFH